MSDSPKNLYKKLFGLKGERLAVNFLKKKGYTIVEKNYKTSYGEADIIAVKDAVIVFCEVKARSNDSFGRPCEAVDAKKQQRYRHIAECFIYERDIRETEIRFDVIEVFGEEINHIEDAFI